MSYFNFVVPGKAPMIDGHTLNSTCLMVELSPGNATMRYGLITKYTVYYEDVDSKEQSALEVYYNGLLSPLPLHSEQSINATLSNLKFYTLYKVYATMSTSVGESIPSNVIFLRTEQAGR